jgi:hypothetical protein
MDTDLEAFLDRCDDVLADWDGSTDAMRSRPRGASPAVSPTVTERERPAHREDEPDGSGALDAPWRVWFDWTC